MTDSPTDGTAAPDSGVGPAQSPNAAAVPDQPTADLARAMVDASHVTAHGPHPGIGWRALPNPAQLMSLIVVGVLSYGAVLMIASLRTILVMLLVSLFISFAMEPAVQYLGRRWGWRRGVATAVVFLIAFVVVVGSLGSIIPLMIDQVGELLRSAPTSAAELNELVSRLPFVDLEIDPEAGLNQELLEIGRSLTGTLEDGLSSMAGSLLGAAGNVVTIGRTAIGVVFQGLTVLLVSFYLVADGPRFRATLARALPQHRQRELLAVWEIAVAKTGGYIYSRLLLAAVAASMTATFLAFAQVPYPLPLGLWVGVTGAFVPVVGTYIGGILVLLVALADRPIKAFWVLVFIIVYQQIENYVIAPRMQAATMDIHPAVAFLSVLIGATLLGAVGALLALPAAAIIQAVASTYVHRNELIEELTEASERLEEHIQGQLPPLDISRTVHG